MPLLNFHYRTDWSKVPQDSEDSSDAPVDATESALHNALTNMHRSGADGQSSSASAGEDSDAGANALQGESLEDVLSVPLRLVVIQLRVMWQ